MPRKLGFLPDVITPGREPAELVHSIVPLFTLNDGYEGVMRAGQTLAVPGSEVGVASNRGIPSMPG